MPKPLTQAEIDWQQAQPVTGAPSLTRLRIAVKKAGLSPVEIALADDGENLEFRLLRSAGLEELEREQMLRLLIAVLRESGFEVGYTEAAIIEMDDQVVAGLTLTGPLDEICEIGPPLVER